MVLLVDHKSTKTCLHAAAHTHTRTERGGGKREEGGKRKKGRKKKKRIDALMLKLIGQHVVELKSSILIPAFLLHRGVG